MHLREGGGLGKGVPTARGQTDAPSFASLTREHPTVSSRPARLVDPPASERVRLVPKVASRLASCRVPFRLLMGLLHLVVWNAVTLRPVCRYLSGLYLGTYVLGTKNPGSDTPTSPPACRAQHL